MLPSVLRNIFWGAQQPVVPEGEEVKHTAREEAGDWLLISRQNSCDSGNSNSNSRVNSECDLDSVCSDSSWVITPAPAFQRSSDPAHPSIGATHSLEDLLIEHPTMSVYRQNSTNEMDSTNREDEEQQDTAEQVVIDQTNEQQNRIHQIALIENERRRQLAEQMQIPLTTSKAKRPPPKDSKPSKLTRRALKRHNPMTRVGAKHQVQKCGFKAGRRRC